MNVVDMVIAGVHSVDTAPTANIPLMWDANAYYKDAIKYTGQ